MLWSQRTESYQGELPQSTTPIPVNQAAQATSLHQTDQHVTFDLSPSPAPHHLAISPLTNVPHHGLIPLLTHIHPYLTLLHPPLFIYQVLLQITKSLPMYFSHHWPQWSTPPGLTRQSGRQALCTNALLSPDIPHLNHGHSTPQAGPHHTRSKSSLPGPAGSQCRKKTNDLDPFFEDDQTGKSFVGKCIL